MTNQILSSTLRLYAIAGAQARLAEMSQEAEAIRRAFPELRSNGRQTGVKSANLRAADRNESAPTARRRRSKMPAAQRKAVGERMKKYWAARRAGNGAAGATATRTAKAAGAARRGRRKMSAAGRKRISDAQKKRWAARRAKA
jgi:hypothetical protein